VQTGPAGIAGKLNQALRRLSGETVFFHQGIAERLGLHPTDHKCLDLLTETGPITAGRLAELTGLTTGAITGVIDRQERAGFVRREDDPDDRRRVIIQPVPEREPEVSRLFESLARAMSELCDRYSEEELALILDFVLRSRAVLHEEAARLRAAGEP
jgi:DNA-binding MarR family transcriptional regulator